MRAELHQRQLELEDAYDRLLVAHRGRVAWDKAEEQWHPLSFYPEEAEIARRLNDLEAAQRALLNAAVCLPRNDCE